MNYRRLALIGLGMWGLASGTSVPGAAPVPLRTRAGEVSLSLRRVEVRRSSQARLDSQGRISGSPSSAAEATLEFNLTSPSAPAVEAVLRGPVSEAGKRFEAVDATGRTTRDITAEVVEIDETPVLRMVVRGLSPQASELRTLRGELSAFPQVRRVRFHVPWLKDEVPLSVDYQGGRATLDRFQLVEEDSTLWVTITAPDGFHVAPFELPGAVDARAVDIYGNLVNRGGITRTELVQSGTTPQYRFFAPGMKRTPSRLTLDVLCVAGEPRGVPFRATGITLLPR